jgi:hypothetical protein
MRVEVLYVAECPGRRHAVQLVRGILAAEGVVAEIHEVFVKDERMANKLKFPGSPTIRIDGRDVGEETGERQGFALRCRLYSGAKVAALPPAELVRRAIAKAQGRIE